MKTKKPYVRPNLTSYGSVRNLTGGSFGGMSDAGGSMVGGMMMMMG